MQRTIGRGLRLAGVTLFCAFGISVTQFLAPADDVSATPPAKKIDLRHLQPTASGDLPVKLTFPGPGTFIGGPATQVTAQTVRGAAVEISINGEIVPARNLGKMTIEKDGTTQYDYYGVLIHPGPNTIIATAIGINGTRGQPETETVFGPGPAVAIHASLIGSLIADGKSQARLLVDAVDQWNNPALPGSEVQVALVSGHVDIGNAKGAAFAVPVTSSLTPGTPAPNVDSTSHPAVRYQLLEGGRVTVPITASLQSGLVQVQVAIGNITDLASFNVAPYLRKPFVNGMISLGAGSVPAAVDGDGRYDGGGARKERVALFATGRVLNKSSLTISYESQNRLQQSSVTGPFVADPNERPYQTYGDASTVTSDFHSADRFYARIDNGRNDLMWGQYQTAVGDPTAVVAYQRQVSGIKGDLGIGTTGRGRIMGFNAKDDNAYVSFTVPVSGLATLLQPLHANIVIGSDRITLVALDRRTGVPISQKDLQRNFDYTIDYATGTLRFINVPLPLDFNFNPQVLYFQYEYTGPDVKSETTGFDFRYGLDRNNATMLDLGYINDATGSLNYSLSTQTVTSRMANGEWHISHAVSSGGVPSGAYGTTSTISHGSATTLAFSQRVAGNDIGFTYQDTGAGFANPFGGFNPNGIENIQATFAHRTLRGGLSITASQIRNTGSDQNSVQQDFQALWESVVSNALAVTLGMQATHDMNAAGAITPGQGASVVTGSTAQLQAGLRWKPSRRTSVTIDHQESLGGNANVMPAQTTAEVHYDMGNAGRVYLRELLGGAAGSFANSTAAYTAAAIGTHSTQLGFERNMGPNTSVDTSYLIDNTGNQTNIYTTLGIQETFKLGKHLAGNAVFQNAHGTGDATTGFSVFGTGLTYSLGNDFRSSFSLQSRGGPGGGSTLAAGAAGHIGQNIALVADFNQTASSAFIVADDRLSLAFRPSDNDRLISLLGFERQTGGVSGVDGASDVLSFEEVYRPTLSTEIAGRVGYKLNGDGFYLAHTSVYGMRVTQDLGKRFDLGAEFRGMTAGNVGLGRATDFATEFGYKAPGGLRLAGGYNFSGSVDPTLTGHPVRKGFYVTVTTMLDKIFGWGKP